MGRKDLRQRRQARSDMLPRKRLLQAVAKEADTLALGEGGSLIRSSQWH
ncbi:MAG: hypothetical protein U0176_04305 [Bacteroidia bacterium]